MQTSPTVKHDRTPAQRPIKSVRVVAASVHGCAAAEVVISLTQGHASRSSSLGGRSSG